MMCCIPNIRDNIYIYICLSAAMLLNHSFIHHGCKFVKLDFVNSPTQESGWLTTKTWGLKEIEEKIPEYFT